MAISLDNGSHSHYLHSMNEHSNKQYLGKQWQDDDLDMPAF